MWTSRAAGRRRRFSSRIPGERCAAIWRPIPPWSWRTTGTTSSNTAITLTSLIIRKPSKCGRPASWPNSTTSSTESSSGSRRRLLANRSPSSGPSHPKGCRSSVPGRGCNWLSLIRHPLLLQANASTANCHPLHLPIWRLSSSCRPTSI